MTETSSPLPIDATGRPGKTARANLPAPTGANGAPVHARAARAALVVTMLFAGLYPGAAARAEKADKDKPLNIEADSMRYDDAKKVNVFDGNVTLTKGTILLKADRLVLREDAGGFQYGTATGTPARFRQKRDGVDQFVAGEALRIEYDGKTETVRLQHKATMTRLQGERVTDEVHGNLITYESRSEFFTVESGGPKAATPDNPSGRVRVIIQPKQNDTGKPAPATLAPARSIGATNR